MGSYREREPVISRTYDDLIKPLVIEALIAASDSAEDDAEFMRYVMVIITHLVDALQKMYPDYADKKHSEIFDILFSHMKTQYALRDKQQSTIDSLKVMR